MEASLPLIMLIGPSLSWMSIKVDMLIWKHLSNVVWNEQVDPKFVGNTTFLTLSVRYMLVASCMHMVAGYIFLTVVFVNFFTDGTEQPKAPTVTVSTVEQTSISLSWEVSKTCFESVDFTLDISWRPTSGEGQAMNVSGNSYNITDLTPGVSYNITLVAIGNGVRSDCISISTITLASGKHNACYPLRPIII